MIKKIRTETKYEYLTLVILLFCVRICYISGNTNVLNLKDCMDPDFEQWQVQNAQYCKDNKLLHCQNDHLHDRIYSMCAVAVTCGEGTFAKLNIEQGVVECTACSTDMYQPQSKASFKYLQPHCDRIKRQCDLRGDKVQCEAATSSQDFKCRCNKAGGYKPNMGSCDCFTNDDACECDKVTCKEGEQLNVELDCVTIPTTASTPTSPPITTAATISAQSTSGDIGVIVGATVGAIVGVVIIVVALILLVRRCKRNSSKWEVTEQNICCCILLKKLDSIPISSDEVDSHQNSSRMPPPVLSDSNPDSNNTRVHLPSQTPTAPELEEGNSEPSPGDEVDSHLEPSSIIPSDSNPGSNNTHVPLPSQTPTAPELEGENPDPSAVSEENGEVPVNRPCEVTTHDVGKLALDVKGGERVFGEALAEQLKLAARQKPETHPQNIGQQIIVNDSNVNIGPHSQMNVVKQNTQPEESSPSDDESEDENTQLMHNRNSECDDINLRIDGDQLGHGDGDQTDVKHPFSTHNGHTTADSQEDTAVKQPFISDRAQFVTHGRSDRDDTVNV